MVKELGGVTELSTAAISEIAPRYRIEGKTKNGKKTKMDSRAIRQAMGRDTNNFIRKGDGTYSLADELKEKTKTKKKEKTKTKKKKKKWTKMTTEREIGEILAAFKKIEVEDVREEAEEEAFGLNFKEGSGVYVAFTVLRMGEAAGVTELNPIAISKIARQLGLGGETKKGKKKKMDSNTIRMAMLPHTNNFISNGDGTYSLADKLKEKTKATTEQEIEKILAAIDKSGAEDVLREEAEEEAIELNFEKGRGAYIAFTVLRMVKELGWTELKVIAISKIARQLGLGGETETVAKMKIIMAMRRDTNNFICNGDGTYSLADKLKKKTRKTTTKKTKATTKKKTTTTKKKNTGRNKHLVEHVKREDWDLTKYGDVGFYGNEEEWCPLCDGRTVVRAASSYVMFYSNVLLWATTQELLIERFGMKIKREHVKKVLDRFFEDNQGANQKVFNFNSFCREKAELCFHCNQKLCEWIHSIQD
jgi:hypothetical protein